MYDAEACDATNKHEISQTIYLYRQSIARNLLCLTLHISIGYLARNVVSDV